MIARGPAHARGRNWGPGEASRDRVERMDQALRQGAPTREPITFESLRVELQEPDATDGELHQACLDAGLVVEEE